MFTSLDPFTVTLNDGRRTRVLHVAITLRVEDDASRRLVTEFMPMVRDRVLKVLAAQDPSRIQSAEGREELVIALTDSLRSSYDPSPATPRISDVLFTAFVIQ
ncbi:flagellar basal body-associated FliL family protein [Paenalcaligenes niemegkensis]|nr:flagellar basal body-associated FliL family protein [Paenalcaligenes niemegkensis]